ncbi:hypothetical protein ACQY0O_000925 [Thecaphora frezii]
MASTDTSEQAHQPFQFFQPPFPHQSDDMAGKAEPLHAVDYASADSLFSRLSSQSAAALDARPQAAQIDGGYDPIAKLSSRLIPPLPSSPPASNHPEHGAPSSSTSPYRAPPPASRVKPGHVASNGVPPTMAPSATTPRPSKPTHGSGRSHKQQDDAAYRQLEVDRRNQLREGERIKRQHDLQMQVDRSMEAIRSEKESERANLLLQREQCARAALGLGPSEAFSWSLPVAALDAEEAIGRQVRSHWEASRPSASSIQRRQSVVDRIQHAIDLRWPGHGLQVAPFGSSVTGLVSDRSDLDLVLLDPTRPHGVGTPQFLENPPYKRIRQIDGMPDWYNVRVVAAALKSSNARLDRPDKFKNIVAISGANVPIVKLVDVETDLPADLNINERFGLINSQMIETYANLQPELFRPMVFFLKHWFSQRELNDPSGAKGPMSLSSYTIALMAIQYLQLRGLLPNLQDRQLIEESGVPRAFVWGRSRRVSRRKNALVCDLAPGFDVTFAPLTTTAYRDRAIQDVWAANPNIRNPFDKLLGQHVVGFIEFYDGFSRQDLAVSVVNGRPLELDGDDCELQSWRSGSDSIPSGSSDSNQGSDGTSDPGYYVPPGVLARENFKQPSDWAKQELVVQDPFIIDRNTSRNVGERVIYRIEGELQRAKEMLSVRLTPRSTVQNLPLVCDVCAPLSVVPAVQRAGEAASRSARLSRQSLEASTGNAAPRPRPFLNEEAGALRREKERQEAKRLKAQRSSERQKQKGEPRSKAGPVSAAGDAARRGGAGIDTSASKAAPAPNGHGQQSGSSSRSETSESEDIDLVALRLERLQGAT